MTKSEIITRLNTHGVWVDALILEIEELAKKCQELFENGYLGTENYFDDFIERWDFNERFEPGPHHYDHRGDDKLVEMKVDLLMVYIEMKHES